ncbi:hypothetical protein FOA43_003366 [Brettanomyces nanus]|uniref:Pre-mRNA-splicing factor CWC22 n=1 Tax=Eeniella nana TaxID=13502 RepID=A0A875RQ64_EENNA|nr:uncharacterized protein FOA43_003366 [Brettanomyces nanus]QPG75980.1 hypothetical protein FOA43_003366 [Brettanomyces nanus]
MSDSKEELKSPQKSGAYVPPAKLKEIQGNAQFAEGSEDYQKLQWETLKKSINGLVNRVTKENLKDVVINLFKLDIVRGKGLLVKSLMKSQRVSEDYSSVYASLVSVINSKIPEIGKLLITRLVLQFKKDYKIDNKQACTADLSFISQLTNFQVSHEILVLQILYELLEKPINDSVELAVELMMQCGHHLHMHSKVACNAIFERLRAIRTESLMSSRVQYILDKLFELRRKGLEDEGQVDDDLDITEEEDKITHSIGLSDELNGEWMLDDFRCDEDYDENEKKYEKLRKEILGESVDDEGEHESAEGSEESSEEEFSDSSDEDNDGDDVSHNNDNEVKEEIKDLTEQELTNFQKSVYLNVMGSMGPEEAVHKLLKLDAIDHTKHEYMVVDMLVKCCAQEKSYSKFYGLIGEGLILVGRKWEDAFNLVFEENWDACHRYETSLLRNIGTFWGHMLSSDKMGWEVLRIIKLTQEDTSSAQRILLKFVFLRIRSELGVNELLTRLNEPYIKSFIQGLFPETSAEHIRFSINYFTAIGLGRLTEDMRETLKNLPDSDGESGRSSSRSSSYSSGKSSRSSSRSLSRSSSRSPSRSPSRSSTRAPFTDQPPHSRKKPRWTSSSRAPGSRDYGTNANAIPLGPKRG